jgi:hypothetical protein
VDGCTVGVVRIPGGVLFFKNRDLAGEYLANRVTVYQSTPEVHALRGVNLKTKALEGVSIGVNRHGICVANTHVASTAGVTYDLLCEQLVHQAKSKKDVPEIVRGFVQHNRVQGGRILVASSEWAFLVEVFEDLYEMVEVEGNLAITNSFSLLPPQGKRPGMRERSSAERLQVASGMIETVSSIGALKSLLRSHVPQKGELSICNHREDGGGTESSHIIQIQGTYVGWSASIGYPCENDYDAVQLFQR